LVRGKSLYENTCAKCHAADLRGSATGISLLRSGVALSDQHGELVAAAVAKHTPAINLVNSDTAAIAEYLHSVLATTGGQGSPPGRNPANVALNVLVGDPKAGEVYFTKNCGGCHAVSGDLKGIASKYPDPRNLQNAWVAGSGGGGRGRGASPVLVTMRDGTKLQGNLIRNDDFLVILTLPDGTRKSIARVNGIPAVEVTDTAAAHKKMVLALDDPANKNMHDVTAYLATLK
jgi:cytochrome c oxidase cbb3-type subunit 3